VVKSLTVEGRAQSAEHAVFYSNHKGTLSFFVRGIGLTTEDGADSAKF